MSTAIKIENLVKSYGQNVAIKGISFSVNKGEIYALLGANGAGKTTTLECIEGIRKYDSGIISVNGKVGVQLQSSSLPGSITAMEAYKLFCKWNKEKEDEEIIESFSLKKLNKEYKALSTGQKRRLHLALALIGNPDIIFLDEPTAGLDVEGRVALHDEIRKLKDKGKTIILASHDMAEVESLCDRIAILKDGKIAFMGTPNELTGTYLNNCKIMIKTSKEFRAVDLKFCKAKGVEQGYFVFDSSEIGEALLEILNTAKADSNIVLDVKIERASLEQRFIEIAKEDLAI